VLCQSDFQRNDKQLAGSLLCIQRFFGCNAATAQRTTVYCPVRYSSIHYSLFLNRSRLEPKEQIQMITVIATIHCTPGHRDDFLREFGLIIPTVLKEEGCIEYGPTTDAETSIGNQHTHQDRITIVEKWESLPALEAHLSASHMEAYRPKVKDFVASTELRILKPA